MKNVSFHVLRVGMATTFTWIGVLILEDPEGWGMGFVQPWALNFLIFPLKTIMLAAAIFDIIVGIWLLIGRFVWLAALLGSIHLATVLIVSGINAITVRDIGLLGGSLALFFSTFPFATSRNKINQ